MHNNAMYGISVDKGTCQLLRVGVKEMGKAIELCMAVQSGLSQEHCPFTRHK